MKKVILLAILSATSILTLHSQEFTIDPGHTSIQFSVERFGTVNVLGRFNQFEGTVTIDKESKKITSAVLTIDPNSLDSGHKIRDGHLKSEIWLDVQKYPELKFELISIQQDGNQHIAKGKLKLHGVTKELSFPFQIKGPQVDPTKSNAIGISAKLKINRQDFGISFSKLMDNGQLFIGNEVIITINVLAIES